MGNNSQQFKWIVYCTKCSVNNKIYIGVHKTINPDVFDGYIGGGWEIGSVIKNPKTAYERALKKYGYKSFTRSTIKIFDNYKDAYKLEEEIVDIAFVKRRDTYNTKTGGIGGGNYKNFYQYDMYGNYLKTWNSREEILDYYNNWHDVNRVHRAVINKISAFDSYWTIEYIDKLDIELYKNSTRSTIYQYDINGNEIAKFNSAKECSKTLSVSLDFANEAINSGKCIKNTFLTKDPNKIFDIIKIHNDSKYINDNAISIYKDYKIVKTFSSINDLSKYLNVKYKDIKSAINNSTELCGYLISYGFNEKYNGNKNPGLKIAQYDLDGNLIKIWDTIAECSKNHPKVRLVLKGFRNHTHGYVFKIVD